MDVVGASRRDQRPPGEYMVPLGVGRHGPVWGSLLDLKHVLTESPTLPRLLALVKVVLIPSGLMPSGTFTASFTCSSSNHPIQHAPRPSAHAARRRFWIAAAVSWTQNRLGPRSW